MVKDQGCHGDSKGHAKAAKGKVGERYHRKIDRAGSERV